MLIGSQNRKSIYVGNQERPLAYKGTKLVHPTLPSGLVGWWVADKLPIPNAKQLMDISGNGNHVTLYNFADVNESGYIYEQDFSAWTNQSGTILTTKERSIVTITKSASNGRLFYRNVVPNGTLNFSFKVTGISSLPTNGFIVFGTPAIIQDDSIIIRNDGIYSVSYVNNTGYNATKLFYIYGISDLTNVDFNITIEQIPQGLKFDGVDDYGKVGNLPVMTDFTLIVNRDLGDNRQCLISKSQSGAIGGAFIFEYVYQQTRDVCYSFYRSNNVTIKGNGISYQTKTAYNDTQILKSGDGVDSTFMWLGTIRDRDSRFADLTFKSMMLFDRSLTTEEIQDISNYINN